MFGTVSRIILFRQNPRWQAVNADLVVLLLIFIDSFVPLIFGPLKPGIPLFLELKDWHPEPTRGLDRIDLKHNDLPDSRK